MGELSTPEVGAVLDGSAGTQLADQGGYAVAFFNETANRSYYQVETPSLSGSGSEAYTGYTMNRDTREPDLDVAVPAPDRESSAWCSVLRAATCRG